MDIEHVIVELRRELEYLDNAIQSLERLESAAAASPNEWPGRRRVPRRKQQTHRLRTMSATRSLDA